MISIKQGLDIPIAGAPVQQITPGPLIPTVALVGADYIGMKPTMAVAVGDQVNKGQLLFTDKKTLGVRYTAPASGVITAINRGERRLLQSVVIDIDHEGEQSQTAPFTAYAPEALTELTADQIEQALNQAGLWAALRTRPFSKVPPLGTRPRSIFITAIDTHPLAADPAIIINEQATAFVHGITVLNQLSPNRVFLCTAPKTSIPAGNATVKTFAGPHPAGLPSTHMHFLDPVSATKTVWQIGYQDVIAVGKLLTTGLLYTDRVISLAGPPVQQPRLIRTRLGADLKALTAGELQAGDHRLISGSILGGRTAQGAVAYLGRYHNQVSVLQEGSERLLLSWLNPTVDRHSVMNVLFSRFNRRRLFHLSTTTNGSERAMVPVGNYEKVMPLDILPTQLLRALLVGDTEMAQKLGALELEEEDLALCSYVCAGKYEYGPILRDNLTRIEQEG